MARRRLPQGVVVVQPRGIRDLRPKIAAGADLGKRVRRTAPAVIMARRQATEARGSSDDEGHHPGASRNRMGRCAQCPVPRDGETQGVDQTTYILAHDYKFLHLGSVAVELKCLVLSIVFLRILTPTQYYDSANRRMLPPR